MIFYKKLSYRRETASACRPNKPYYQKLDSPGYICRWQHGSLKLQWIWGSWLRKLLFCVKKAWLDRSRSLKVTDFGTDRKPVCDFLLLYNTNLYTMSHHFQIFAALPIGQIIAFDRGFLYVTPSYVVNPWTLDCEIWPQKTRNIILSCSA